MTVGRAHRLRIESLFGSDVMGRGVPGAACLDSTVRVVNAALPKGLRGAIRCLAFGATTSLNCYNVPAGKGGSHLCNTSRRVTDLLNIPRPAKNVSAKPRPLTEADAVDIWIARWLRTRPRDLVARYGCDNRRLYDIWWGHAFPASRARAEKVFAERYPEAVERTAFGYRRIPLGKAQDPRQPGLFDLLEKRRPT
jgi:hypothetical protein